LERRQANTRFDRAREVAGLVFQDPIETLGGQIVAYRELPSVAVSRRERR